jgi:hypothetical protein
MNQLSLKSEALPRLWRHLATASIAIAFAWFALAQSVPAVTPAPDGGYPNFNTAEGDSALFGLTTGQDNTATGFQALHSNQSGHDNTEGWHALGNNTGSANIAVGSSAGINLTTGSNNIDIGAPGVAPEANTIRIGKVGTQKATFVAGIRGVTVASGVGVIVGTTGQLGTVISSARFKDNIKVMDNASEAILSLKPVTFRYKEELDPDHVPQFGLIAEEVAKVNPDLVARGEDGKVVTVRYEAVNVMLLNEFLKAHRRLEEQQTMIAQQQKQIEALTAGLQKVTARVEAGNSAQQVISDERQLTGLRKPFGFAALRTTSAHHS